MNSWNGPTGSWRGPDVGLGEAANCYYAGKQGFVCSCPAGEHLDASGTNCVPDVAPTATTPTSTAPSGGLTSGGTLYVTPTTMPQAGGAAQAPPATSTAGGGAVTPVSLPGNVSVPGGAPGAAATSGLQQAPPVGSTTATPAGTPTVTVTATGGNVTTAQVTSGPQPAKTPTTPALQSPAVKAVPIVAGGLAAVGLVGMLMRSR